MESRLPLRRCLCARSNPPLSSALLFLSIILPKSSFAQVTSTTPTPISRPSVTLSTSTTPSSTSPHISSRTQSSPPNHSDPTVASTTDTTTATSNPGTHAFNYYFLIVAVVAVLFCVCVLYIGRRKKRKAALIGLDGRHALARDVESWRSRFGVGRVGGSGNDIHSTGREEGLDERGEAPPPYVPGSKPPSIRTEDRRHSTSSRHVEDVHLGRLSRDRDRNRPPRYFEHADLGSEEDIADTRRPEPVVTAS